MKKLVLFLIPLMLFGEFGGVIKRVVNLELNGSKFQVPIGLESEIKSGKRKFKIKVEPNPIFKFNHPNIKFDFDSTVNISYDSFPSNRGFKAWFFNKNSFSAIILEYPYIMDESSILNKMAKEYNRIGAKINQNRIYFKFQNGSLKGKNIKIYLGSTVFSQDIFTLYGKNKSIVFVLRDILRDGKNSKEYQNMLKMLIDSLKIRGLIQKDELKG
jgi:hypothetical protein